MKSDAVEDVMYGPVRIGCPCRHCGVSQPLHLGLTCTAAKWALEEQQRQIFGPLIRANRELRGIRLMKPANYGPFYAMGLYPKLAELFRRHGYALAIHGSLSADMDLIAVPWTDDASDPQAIIKECIAAYAFKKIPDAYRGEKKPHGRLAFRVPFSFDTCSMDVSFTPRKKLRKRREYQPGPGGNNL